jgi:hypothetical protein
MKVAVKSSSAFFQEDNMKYFFKKHAQNERQIKVEFLDVPNLHSYCEEGLDFIAALVEYNKNDLNATCFANETVSMIVN